MSSYHSRSYNVKLSPQIYTVEDPYSRMVSPCNAHGRDKSGVIKFSYLGVGACPRPGKSDQSWCMQVKG